MQGLGTFYPLVLPVGGHKGFTYFSMNLEGILVHAAQRVENPPLAKEKRSGHTSNLVMITN